MIKLYIIILINDLFILFRDGQNFIRINYLNFKLIFYFPIFNPIQLVHINSLIKLHLYYSTFRLAQQILTMSFFFSLFQVRMQHQEQSREGP